MKKDSKILVIGHKSIAGRALLKRLKADGYGKVCTIPLKDLAKQDTVERFFKKARPDYVFVMDIRSGGIVANSTYPAEFLYDNLQAQLNVIHFACMAKAKKLLFMASSCSYPKRCRQPMKEEHLLGGPLEPTSEAYSIAKIAGIKMCQYYNRQYGADLVSAIPATIYGPHDDFDLKTSHVIPALIRKFHAAKAANKPSVIIWGSGRPRREFIHVDDLVDAAIFVMKNPKIPPVVNIGTGKDTSIRELAGVLKDVTGFKGRLVFDRAKPDGAYRKLLDTARLGSAGWRAKVGLKAGLESLYKWYTAA